MYGRVAGLAPDPEKPGYKHFFVRPIIGGPLTSARAELETAYGTASSGWKKSGNTLEMDVVVPPNTGKSRLIEPMRQLETKFKSPAIAGFRVFRVFRGFLRNRDINKRPGTTMTLRMVFRRSIQIA